VNALGAASATDPNSLVLDGGVIDYSGSSATSTNRRFTLTVNGGGVSSSAVSPSSTVAWTSGTAFQFDGSGNVAVALVANHTLTFTGSNTGNNTFALPITDKFNSPANVTSVVKTGLGTWTLTGANTYTGNTTITQGELGFSGVLANFGPRVRLCLTAAICCIRPAAAWICPAMRALC